MTNGSFAGVNPVVPVLRFGQSCQCVGPPRVPRVDQVDVGITDRAPVQDFDVDGLGLSVMTGHKGEADFISLAKIAAGHPTGPRVVFLVTTTGGDEAVSQGMPELHGTVLLAR